MMNNFKRNIFKTVNEIPVINSIEYLFSDTGNTNPATACTLIDDSMSLYSSDLNLTIGSILYTNVELTITFNGLGRSWHTGGLPGLTYLINNTGSIIDTASC